MPRLSSTRDDIDEFLLNPANDHLGGAALQGIFGSERSGHWYNNRRYVLRKSLVDAAGQTIRPDNRSILIRISELLKKSGIDIDEIGSIEKVRSSTRQTSVKGKGGLPTTLDLHSSSIVFSPKWKDGPEWPVVAQSPPITVTPRPPQPVLDRPENWKVAVAFGDTQIGYWRDSNDIIHPIHDERFLDLATQIVGEVQPDRVIMAGDITDLAEMSRFRLVPTFARTIQATVDRSALLLANLRGILRDDATIDWMQANHEVRLSHYILDNAQASFSLKRALMPDSWPVLSLPFLCRFDEFGVNYVEGYPNNALWLSDRLFIDHGEKAAKGRNAYAYLSDLRSSMVFFHSHRAEIAYVTKTSRYGPRTIMAANPGCGCRVDGVVPGSHSGFTAEGSPVNRHENWQQGLCVLGYTEPDGMFSYEHVPVYDGVAHFRGREYRSRCDVEGNI